MKKTITVIALSLLSSVIFAQTQKYLMFQTAFRPVVPIDSINSHSVVIDIGLHPVDGIPPDFYKQITVIFSNNLTVSQVDQLCTDAIINYLKSINK
jgi:hypothetical protein